MQEFETTQVFLAQVNGGEAPAAGGGLMGMLLPFVMMIGVLYLLIIRPQQKQKKQMQIMLNNLKINDKVITAAGMIGKVTNIQDDKGLVTIRVDDTTNTKIVFQKSAVVTVLSSSDDEGEKQ